MNMRTIVLTIGMVAATPVFAGDIYMRVGESMIVGSDRVFCAVDGNPQPEYICKCAYYENSEPSGYSYLGYTGVKVRYVFGQEQSSPLTNPEIRVVDAITDGNHAEIQKWLTESLRRCNEAIGKHPACRF